MDSDACRNAKCPEPAIICPRLDRLASGQVGFAHASFPVIGSADARRLLMTTQRRRRDAWIELRIWASSFAVAIADVSAMNPLQMAESVLSASASTASPTSDANDVASDVASWPLRHPASTGTHISRRPQRRCGKQLRVR
jgi:hypothetical protein